MIEKKIVLLGAASGIAGVNLGVAEGPKVIQKSTLFQQLQTKFAAFAWQAMLETNKQPADIQKELTHFNTELAMQTAALAKQKKFFTVVGGDHACAIGTWSGVADALHEDGDLGLIWIDAHMDSHTPETSETQRIHGMPLACLLGEGFPSLTSILVKRPKLLPENICLIGVRSYESGEAEFLGRLGVRIYFMDEVKRRGVGVVLKEAQQLVSKNTAAFGVSLDIDSMDPEDAPGVDVPEPDGIRFAELYAGLSAIIAAPNLIGLEIVEFDPSRDILQKTEKLIISLLEMIAVTRLGLYDKRALASK